jgi:hypothetical protein
LYLGIIDFMPEGKGDSPHGKGPYGAREQRDILGGIEVPDYKKVSSEMTEPGLFDSPQAVTLSTVEPITEVKTELEPRSLKFKVGTRIYKIDRDGNGNIKIPRTPAQADDLLKKILTVPTYFDVPVEYLERGKRGGTITKKVGQSDYGAFTVVRFPVRLKSGKVVMEDMLASYTTRSSKKNL